MSKPVVLILCGYYLPGFKAGGPVKTISYIIGSLSNDFIFRLITRDRDLGDESSYSSVFIDTWIHFDDYDVFYRSRQQSGYKDVKKLLLNGDFDVLYINSFFDYNYSIKPLLIRWLLGLVDVPVILAPRGELSSGALGLKAFKKKVFIFLSRIMGLHRNVLWHASSEFEKRDIVSAYKVSPDDVFVARDIGVSLASIKNSDLTISGDIMKVVFLSRISPMKNLVFALQVLKKVSSPLVFDIYGPIEDEHYWDECKKIIVELPRYIEVNYCGSLHPDDVYRILRRYELFFLPTQGENFGHVISEALASGLPVLISDQTPWRGLESHSVGWDLPLDDMDAFARRIDDFAQLSPEQRLTVRRAVLANSAELLDANRDIEDTREMFHFALNTECR